MGLKGSWGKESFKINLIETHLIAAKVIWVILESNKIIIKPKSEIWFKSVVNPSKFNSVNKVAKIQISWALEDNIIEERDLIVIKMVDSVPWEEITKIEIV